MRHNSADAEQIEVGWWPGDGRYQRPAFFGFAVPAPDGFAGGDVAPLAARWDADLGEYLLDWDDVISTPDPFGAALEFARSVVAHACSVADWDPDLTASAHAVPPPVR